MIFVLVHIQKHEEVCFHFDGRQFTLSRYVQNCQINGGMWEYLYVLLMRKFW